jgi:spore maturation protein CgeB
VERARAESDREAGRRLAERVRASHSFDARSDAILAVIARLAERGAGDGRRIRIAGRRMAG